MLIPSDPVQRFRDVSLNLPLSFPSVDNTSRRVDHTDLLKSPVPIQPFVNG